MFSDLRQSSQENDLLQNAVTWFLSEDADWLRVSLAGFLFAKIVLVIATILAIIDLESQGISQDLLTMWHRFDSLMYVDIAENGYKFGAGSEGFQNTVAFFPLYPFLISTFKPVFGSAQIAGMIVSNILYFPALVAVYHLAYFEFKDRGTARRTVAFLVAFPAAYYYSVTMTETLFLLLLTLGIYFARRRMWFYAAVAGALVAVTRPHGIFVMGFIGLEWLSAHGWKLSEIHRLANWKRLPAVFARENLPSLFVLLLMPIGLLLYMLFLNREFNDPLAFNTAQWAWKLDEGYFGIHEILYYYLSNMKFWFGLLIDGTLPWGSVYDAFRASINVLSVSAAWVITFFTWRKLGINYTLLTIPITTLGLVHTWFSLLRYNSVVVPLFLTMGYYIKNERLARALVVVMASIQIFLAWKLFTGLIT